MVEPVLVGFIFADRVIEETNHKKGIIGTFTHFNSSNVPVVFPLWFIYAAVANVAPHEKHSFSVSIAHEESQMVVFSAGGEFSVEDLKTVVELPIPVSMAFPKFGAYVATFTVDRHDLATRKLDVKENAGGGA